MTRALEPSHEAAGSGWGSVEGFKVPVTSRTTTRGAPLAHTPPYRVLPSCFSHRAPCPWTRRTVQRPTSKHWHALSCNPNTNSQCPRWAEAGTQGRRLLPVTLRTTTYAEPYSTLRSKPHDLGNATRSDILIKQARAPALNPPTTAHEWSRHFRTRLSYIMRFAASQPHGAFNCKPNSCGQAAA